MADSRSFYPPTKNGHGANGENNGNGELTVSRFSNFKDLVVNYITSRIELIKRWLDPRRNLDYECGYPSGYISPDYYQRLYEMDPLAGRVVELYPKECFQTQPEIYEDEDPDTVTAWEEALYNMCDRLGGTNSYSQTSKLARLIEIIRRADIVSGIGCYGVYIIGIDDNVDLSIPAKMRPPREKKRKKKGALKEKTEANAPEEVKTEEGTVVITTENAAYYETVPTSTAIPDERPYVRDADGNLVLPGKVDPNDPLAKPPPRKYSKGTTRNLNYIQVFSEAHCRVSQWDLDPNSDRFGRPTYYQVQFGAYGQGEGSTMPVETKEVHWTRVVHLTDVSHHAPDNQNYAAPRQRPVLPRILDARKVYGPDAESFYRNGIPTWAFETHPELGAVDLDLASLKSNWEEGNNSLSRLFASEGGSMKPLVTSIPDPTPHILIHIQAICYKLGCPQRIFLGSERGELASSQDDAAWNDRLRERQELYITPCVIEPLIDRLIALGVLPEPEAEDGYKVWWPDLESQSDSEKAAIATQTTTAIATFFDPTKELFTRMSEMDFWTQIMGKDEREAKKIVENAAKEREKRKKEKEQEQKEQMAIQDEQARAGMERDLEFQQRQAEQQATQAVVQGVQGAATSQAQGEAATEEAILTEAGIAANEKNRNTGKDGDSPTGNIFCKTGPGGGIDPTCGVGKGGSGSKGTSLPEAGTERRSPEVSSQFRDHVQNVAKQATPDEVAAVKSYTEGGYNRLNDELRKNNGDARQLEGSRKELHDNLQSVINKAGNLPEPMVVYRGVRLNYQEEAQLVRMAEEAARSGKPLNMPGFHSASTGTGIPYDFGDTVFEIRAKRGAPLDAMSNKPGEGEILLPGGNFKVVGVERDARFKDKRQPRTIIQLEQE